MYPVEEPNEGEAEEPRAGSGSEEAGAMEGPSEGRSEDARFVKPIKAEYEMHMLTRMPCRAWCPWCAHGTWARRTAQAREGGMRGRRTGVADMGLCFITVASERADRH